MKLHEPPLFGSYADPLADHGMMQMDANGFGINGHPAFFIRINISHVQFNRKMQLTGTIRLHLYHIGRAFYNGSRIAALDAVGLIICVLCAGMDLNGISVLEYFFVAEDRTIPSVPLIGWEGDQAGDPVLAVDILRVKNPQKKNIVFVSGKKPCLSACSILE